MALIKPPQRGRPPRNHIDVLRTRLWFQAVKLASGLPSAYALEEALEGRPDSDQVWRPRKWDAYERGKKVPKSSSAGKDALALAEAAYPGTAKWFHSPIWHVLRKDLKPLDQRGVDQGLLSLDPVVVDILFQLDRSLPDNTRMKQRHLTAHEFEHLAVLGSFDALVATTLLIQQSSLVGSQELREWALECYEQLQPMVADAPETCLLYPELFTYIDAVCPHWIYLAPNRRMEMVVFWHRQAEQTWAGERMPFIKEELARIWKDRGWSNGNDGVGVFAEAMEAAKGK